MSGHVLLVICAPEDFNTPLMMEIGQIIKAFQKAQFINIFIAFCG